MKLYGLILAILLVLATGAQVQAQERYLAWDAPTTYIDGAQVPEGAIAAYHIYVANKNDVYNIGVPDVVVESAALGVQNPPTRVLLSLVPVTPGKKVAVTAVSNFGNETDPSNSLFNIKMNSPGNERVEKQ